MVLRAFSARRRPMVAREMLVCAVSRTTSAASSASVQRARPAGGCAHTVAIKRASSVAISFRFPSARGPPRGRGPIPSRRSAVWCDTPSRCRRARHSRCRHPMRWLRPPEEAGRVSPGDDGLQRLTLALFQVDAVSYVHRGPSAIQRITNHPACRSRSLRPKVSTWPSFTPIRSCIAGRRLRATFWSSSASLHPRSIA
jgi:hypothetical protein